MVKFGCSALSQRVSGHANLNSELQLVILGSQLKVALRVIAHGADFGSLLAYHNMATVRALPYTVAIAAEHNGVLNILEQTAVALLMRLFDGTYHSNFSAISSKPSSRASLAKVAYMSVHS